MGKSKKMKFDLCMKKHICLKELRIPWKVQAGSICCKKVVAGFTSEVTFPKSSHHENPPPLLTSMKLVNLVTKHVSFELSFLNHPKLASILAKKDVTSILSSLETIKQQLFDFFALTTQN